MTRPDARIGGSILDLIVGRKFEDR